MLLSFWKADTYNSLSSLIVICIEKIYIILLLLLLTFLNMKMVSKANEKFSMKMEMKSRMNIKFGKWSFVSISNLNSAYSNQTNKLWINESNLTWKCRLVDACKKDNLDPILPKNLYVRFKISKLVAGVYKEYLQLKCIILFKGIVEFHIAKHRIYNDQEGGGLYFFFLLLLFLCKCFILTQCWQENSAFPLAKLG